MSLITSEPVEFPVLPLRGMVVYPNIVFPLLVRREKSTRCLEEAAKKDQKILLIAQKNPEIKDPEESDLYSVGTVSTILERFDLPQGMVRVLIKGLYRVNLASLDIGKKCLIASVTPFVEQLTDPEEQEALVRVALDEFEHYIKLSERLPPELIKALKETYDPVQLADTIAAHMPLSLEDKQHVLELPASSDRLEFLMRKIKLASHLTQIDKKIRKRIEKQMDKNQREYYLNEQIKAIQKELADIDEGLDEHELLRQKIFNAKMSEEARKKTESELQKLKFMSPISAEATVIRSYIDWALQVPWHRKTTIKKNLSQAAAILDEEHYGLDRIKERILEYLAVQARINKVKGPILCLVGPPGVGKTSLGHSIARATGRKYVRVALGGVRDEAEIRGHRRTYIGAMPGKIIQKMIKVGVKNPLFLLDEIDKLASDLRGDPAAALLEVLDPEQNTTFNDHYLEIDYDLSNVMFIATANSTNIPAALLDRMEVIHLSGYTETEKFHIARKYLFPKQLERNGLQSSELELADTAILNIIRYYTREAGVRNLERELAKLCRKSVKRLLLDNALKKLVIDAASLNEFLGVRRFDYGRAGVSNQLGQVTGLAWTEAGGDLLTIEAKAIAGKGKLTQTGSLGKVMQESIQAAVTAVSGIAVAIGMQPNFAQQFDIHVHVPEGATPKDGPSAGIAICTALVSVFTNNPVRHDVAMTGEIMLNGNVLPIGGLKDKLLAARRGGIKTVLIPKENEKDLDEIPEEAKNELLIRSVSNITEVLNFALERSIVDASTMKQQKKTSLRKTASMTTGSRSPKKDV